MHVPLDWEIVTVQTPALLSGPQAATHEVSERSEHGAACGTGEVVGV